jgi:CheY-like chemotaxis protein
MATGLTVLIVEDCADIARMEADLVLMCDYAPIIAFDGVEALATLACTSVDLILLDLNLPRLDGQAVLDYLAADPSLSRIPVIIVSANLAPLRATPQVIRIMQKPFDINELLTAIDQSSLALAG